MVLQSIVHLNQVIVLLLLLLVIVVFEFQNLLREAETNTHEPGMIIYIQIHIEALLFSNILMKMWLQQTELRVRGQEIS